MIYIIMDKTNIMDGAYMLEQRNDPKKCLLKGEKADLQDPRVLKETLDSLKNEPAFKQVSELNIALNNTSSSTALETLAAFLINVDHPLDVHLSLSNPLTFFQLTYLKKSVELNPYVEVIDTDQEITVNSSKKVWDNVQATLKRNKEMVDGGFTHNEKLAKIIALREAAEAQDSTIAHLDFALRA